MPQVRGCHAIHRDTSRDTRRDRGRDSKYLLGRCRGKRRGQAVPQARFHGPAPEAVLAPAVGCGTSTIVVLCAARRREPEDGPPVRRSAAAELSPYRIPSGRGRLHPCATSGARSRRLGALLKRRARPVRPDLGRLGSRPLRQPANRVPRTEGPARRSRPSRPGRRPASASHRSAGSPARSAVHRRPRGERSRSTIHARPSRQTSECQPISASLLPARSLPHPVREGAPAPGQRRTREAHGQGPGAARRPRGRLPARTRPAWVCRLSSVKPIQRHCCRAAAAAVPCSGRPPRVAVRCTSSLRRRPVQRFSGLWRVPPGSLCSAAPRPQEQHGSGSRRRRCSAARRKCR